MLSSTDLADSCSSVALAGHEWYEYFKKKWCMMIISNSMSRVLQICHYWSKVGSAISVTRPFVLDPKRGEGWGRAFTNWTAFTLHSAFRVRRMKCTKPSTNAHFFWKQDRNAVEMEIAWNYKRHHDRYTECLPRLLLLVIFWLKALVVAAIISQSAAKSF